MGERVISAVSNSTFSLNRLIAAAGASQVVGSRDASQGQPTKPAAGISGLPAGKSELTDEERQQVEQLQKRDAEVRRHEQAHKAAAGQHARGGATFETQTGPDGRSYAVGGEVSIDTSPVEGDPEATIRKMQQIRAAALAPAEPSSQDRQVAAQATRAAQQARAELTQKDENDEPSSGPTSVAESTTADVSSPSEPADSPAQPNELDPASVSTGGAQSSTGNKSESALVARYASAQRERGLNQAGRFIDVAA